MKRVEEGIYQDAYGYECKVMVGSGKTALKDRTRFPPDTDKVIMRTWKANARAALMNKRRYVTRGTLAADVDHYLDVADISKATKKRRRQQLDWLCAQPAKLGGLVLLLEDVERLNKQDEKPPYKTLGDMPRAAIDPRRLREIFAQAFAPTDSAVDPTEFASTSNNYRTGLLHLYNSLNQDDPSAVNPVKLVKTRPQRGAELKGQDARVVAEILKHLHAPGGGRQSRVSHLRLDVLAWVHITPTQLMQVYPPRDFHDSPDATREDILDGAITLTKQPRLKGRKGRRIPPPETIPLNHLGVAAMRAFAAEPTAWGTFKTSPLNTTFKLWCGRAQAALAERGIEIDLSEMTLYHLKHSLATTASLASAGLVNRQGVVQQSAGVQRALDHAAARMTSIYTQAAVDPIVRAVNRATMLLLENLLREPLRGPNALRLVKG